ncbi:MAG TPA: tetratricopeptide repeat protein, partial [Rhizomicrobium sp.]
MNTPVAEDRQIRALFEAAKQADSTGQQQEAERLRRAAALRASRHPLVLNHIAIGMIKAGNPAGAHALLDQAVEAEPSNPEILFNLAAALRRLSRLDEAVAALDRLLAIEPRNLSALLEKGSIEELQNRPRAAAMTYRTGLQMLPPNFKAPNWMQVPLRRAKEVVEENNRALEAFVEEGLADLRNRFSGQPLRRFDQCVATLLQKRRLYRQQPTFM